MPRSLPLSPQLEYVKQTQIQAQEQRVNARVQELMERRSLTPVISRRIEDQFDASTRSDAVGSSSGCTMPGTAVRKNITQRRSRGRVKDDGENASRASLLARRPRSLRTGDIQLKLFGMIQSLRAKMGGQPVPGIHLHRLPGELIGLRPIQLVIRTTGCVMRGHAPYLQTCHRVIVRSMAL
jgi:hypothetical protein